MDSQQTINRIILHTCKTALAFVWIWEGLVPKILFPSDEEIEMVRNTGLAWWDAASFVPFLGAWEVGLGIVLLLGIYLRFTSMISLLLLLFFVMVIPWYEPSLLYNPYGAITKNAGLIACSVTVYVLAKARTESLHPNAKHKKEKVNELKKH